MTSERHGDLRLAMLALTVAIAVAWTSLLGPFRAVVVLPVILLAPGYLTLRAAFGAAGRNLDPAARAGASVMLSLALQPLLAIACAAVGVRLTLGSVCGANLVLGLTTSLTATFRDRAVQSGVAARSAVELRARARRRVSLVGFVLGVLTVAVFAVIVGNQLPAPPSAGFSEVFLGESLRGGETVQVSPGQSFAVPVLVANRTDTVESYRVRAFLDAQAVQGELRAVVAPATTWEDTLRVTLPTDSCVHRVTVEFTRLTPTTTITSVRTLTVYVQAAALGTACRAQ